MATDVARLSLQIDVTGARRAQSAMESLRSGSVVLTRATEEQIAAQYRLNSSFQAMGSSTRRMAGAFRLQKGAIQQAGYQIGDFAVQVGAGQSALVAFSQQGSQLAGILGPGGAVIGAIIAVGAAVAMPFVRSMGAGEDATKSFTERLEELREATDELTDAQVRQLKLEFKAANRERLKQITSEKENIAELREEQERYQRLIDDPMARNRQARETGVTVTVTDLRKRLKELDGQIDTSRANIDTYRLAADNAAQELKELIEGTDKAGDSAEKAAEKIREMVEAAEQQVATIGLSARATATYEAALAGANAEQILAIDSAYRRVEAHKQEVAQQKALQEQYKITAANDPMLQQVSAQGRGDQIIEGIRKEAEAVRMGLDQEYAIRVAHKERVMALDDALRLGVINSVEERNRLEVLSLKQRNEEIRGLESQKNQILTSGQEKSLQLTGQFFGNLASIAQAGGEDSFQRYQNLASAQAAIAASLAIASVLGDPTIPTGIKVPLAFSIGGLAAVQAAEIQSQEYQGSYLGGGYTGSGSRSGGVDGKGGFPAILHPNETVIDHELGQRANNTSNVNQTIVMNVSGDVTAQTRQEIMKAMPMIRQQAKSVVLSESQNGGAMSRAMGRRS